MNYDRNLAAVILLCTSVSLFCFGHSIGGFVLLIFFLLELGARQ